MTGMTSSSPSRQFEETQQKPRYRTAALLLFADCVPRQSPLFPSGRLHPGSRGKILSHSLSVSNPGESCVWHQASEMELPAERTSPVLSPDPSKEGFHATEPSNAHGSSCSRAAQHLLTCMWMYPQLSICKKERGMAGNIGESQGEVLGVEVVTDWEDEHLTSAKLRLCPSS